MPDREVKTIRDLIYFQYAKIGRRTRIGCRWIGKSESAKRETLDDVNTNTGTGGFMRRILFFGFICLVLWLSNALGGTSIVVKDIDGTVYKTVTIGTQVWMAENFRATRFNDGTPIPCISSDSSWASITRPARCWYKNDSTLNNTVGFLYNGFAATSEKLAPPGWKVPSYEDWQLLESYLKSKGYGCEDTTGRKSSGKYLASKSDWASTSNPGAVGNNSSLNNKSGFSAVPGGYRMDNTAQNPDYHGKFYNIGGFSYWWCSDSKKPYAAMLSYARNCIEMEDCDGLGSGYSIRLVRKTKDAKR